MSTRLEEDRIFNRRGRRHFRRTYSLAEVKVGLAVALILVAVAAWVVWRGARPDPELTMTAADLMKPAAAPASDRGPFPVSLAPEGWKERSLSSFGPPNLYEKINGREGYYKGFGFVKLYFVSLAGEGSSSIDIELYDLGRAENALGAMSGEVPAGVSAVARDGATIAEGRNSVLIARGKYYARLIGSDESQPVRTSLREVAARLLPALPAEEVPFGVALFGGVLGLSPERIGYEAENAFSFGFAKDVHVGRLADDSEMFVVRTASATVAASLAEQFRAGFAQYGEDGGSSKGVSWVRDRYLSTFAGALARGRFVAGVRGAGDRAKAEEAIARLIDALDKMGAGGSAR